MELDSKHILKLDILQAIDSIGAGEVLQVLSEGLRETGKRRFDHWDADLQRLADAIDTLAKHAADFEAYYGAREP